MARISNNIIGSLGIGIVTLIYLSGAVQLPFGSLISPSEGFMPVIASVMLLAVCIFSIGKELILPIGDSIKKFDLKTEDSPDESVNNKRPIKIMIVIIVYPVVLVNLGFMLSTIALLFVTLRLMEYRSWWLSLLVAIATTFLIKFIFDDLFGISLPVGIFS